MRVCSKFTFVSACACRGVRNQNNLQAKKPTNCYSEKALSMTNKSIEIHEIWLAVLTGRHTRRPKDWSCAVGQRWVILYWNAKRLLAEQSGCCFKNAWKLHGTEEAASSREWVSHLHVSHKACRLRCHTQHRPRTLQDWSWSRALNAILILSE